MIIPETWKAGALAAVMVAVLGVISWLAVARANLKTELAQAQADYVLCQNANAEWEARAKVFDDATRKMKEETETRRVKAAKAYETTMKVAEAHAVKAREILTATGKGNDCRTAKNLVRQYLRERK